MKHMKFILLIVAALFLAFCSKDEGNEVLSGDGSHEANTGSVDDVANGNNGASDALVTRLEFPRLRGGSSEVIVHSTAEYGMNYAVEWDHNLRAQRWTCYRLDADNRVVNGSRKGWWPNGDPFIKDPLVSADEQPATTNEFSKSYFPGYEELGVKRSNAYYQKGHVCPSADRLCSKEANEQTFYMTNMLPQVGKFNAGIWSTMEEKVRKLASTVDTLYICKGGTIDYESDRLDYTVSGFIVPKYYFMAILGVKSGEYKAFGFWVEHKLESQSSNLTDYLVSIDELESRTGIDFFCNLPDNIETVVEGKTKNAMQTDWGF